MFFRELAPEHKFSLYHEKHPSPSVWLSGMHAGEQQFKEPRRLGPLFFLSTCAVRECVCLMQSQGL